MVIKLVLAVLLPALLITACADPAGPPSGSPSADPASPTSLWGRTFVSTHVSRDGRPQPLVTGTRIRLTFESGRLRANAGCNDLSGGVRLGDGRLRVAELATTEKGCGQARHEQDAWLSTFLTSAPSWQLEADGLVLTSPQLQVRLIDQRVDRPDKPLRGTHWTVQSIIEAQVARSAPTGTKAHLLIDPQGRVTGSTGCNSLTGTATGSGTTLTFTAATTTRTPCGGDQARLESLMLAALNTTVTVQLEGDQLTITLPDGRRIGLSAS